MGPGHGARFLISSEIKCAHFHGTEVAKPIPSYQVYKGTASIWLTKRWTSY